MTADVRDAALQMTCPTVMVPKYGEFQPLTQPGHRFLAAKDGMWVEVKRSWLYILWPLALQSDFSMPYGEVTKSIKLEFGKIPRSLFNRFVEDARAAFPNEFGAWLVWDDHRKELLYRPLATLEADPDNLRAMSPTLEEGQCLAVDLHSHGCHGAFFSPKDTKDDQGEVKVAGVIGSLHLDKMTNAFRLYTGGAVITLPSEIPEETVW